MGHHQDLALDRDLAQRGPDLGPHFAPDPGIDLVEDEGRHVVVTGQDHLERQHEPGEFAPRRRLGERPRVVPLIEPHGERHLLRPVRLRLGQRRHRRLELSSGQPQLRQELPDGAAESAGGFGALGGEFGRGVPEAPLGRLSPGRQGAQIGVGGVEQVELPRRSVAGGQHGIHAAAVLLGQLEQQITAALDLGQTGRVLGDVVRVLAGQPGELGEVGKGAVEELAPRGGLGVLAFQLGQRPVGLPEDAERPPLVTVERLGEASGLFAEGAGVRQLAGLGLEPHFLARRELGVPDLGHHVTEIVGAPLDLVALAGERGLLVAQGLHGPESLVHRRAGPLGAGERVEDVALGVGPEQGLGLVLAVQVDECGAELGQRGQGGGAPVDPGARPPLRAHLAADDHPLLLGIEPQSVEPAAECRVGIEGPLHHAACRAGADERAVRALAQQEGERIDEHRLPRPGLPGEDVQPLSELQRDFGDRGEVPDAELDDHRACCRCWRSPQWSLSRINSKKLSPSSRTRSTRWSARRTSTLSPVTRVVPT